MPGSRLGGIMRAEHHKIVIWRVEEYCLVIVLFTVEEGDVPLTQKAEVRHGLFGLRLEA